MALEPLEAPRPDGVSRQQRHGDDPADGQAGGDADVGAGRVADAAPAEEQLAEEDGEGDEADEPEDQIGQLQREDSVRVGGLGEEFADETEVEHRDQGPDTAEEEETDL